MLRPDSSGSSCRDRVAAGGNDRTERDCRSGAWCLTPRSCHHPERLPSRVFQQDFDRPNLLFSVIPKPTKGVAGLDQLAAVVNELCRPYIPRSSVLRGAAASAKMGEHRSGIVYCLSRDDTVKVAKHLCDAGIAADFYHAGMTPKQRLLVQTLWQRKKIDVVCATVAYGMGIDLATVRFVVHHCVPKSIEGYYQEAGRAGRDGLPAHCILLFKSGDVGRVRRLIKGPRRRSSRTQSDRASKLLDVMAEYGGNSSGCQRQVLVSYFG